MIDKSQYLTASETAFVANLTTRQVRRAMEDSLLPEPLVQDRAVHVVAVPLLRFYVSMERDLQPDKRLQIITEWCQREAGELAIDHWLSRALPRRLETLRSRGPLSFDCMGERIDSAAFQTRNSLEHLSIIHLSPKSQAGEEADGKVCIGTRPKTDKTGARHIGFGTMIENGTILGLFNAGAMFSSVFSDLTWRDGILSIELKSFFEEAGKRLCSLDRARAVVGIDPGILNGTPVVKGTRIPVHDIAANIEAGIEVTDIVAAYPSLDAETVELCGIYAAAYPLRGRPPQARYVGIPTAAKPRLSRRVTVAGSGDAADRDRQ